MRVDRDLGDVANEASPVLDLVRFERRVPLAAEELLARPPCELGEIRVAVHDPCVGVDDDCDEPDGLEHFAQLFLRGGEGLLGQLPLRDVDDDDADSADRAVRRRHGVVVLEHVTRSSSGVGADRLDVRDRLPGPEQLP